MKKTTLFLLVLNLIFTTFAFSQVISNEAFQLSNSFGDLRMRRYISGDLTYKRALVPSFNTTTNTGTLIINYHGDFTGGTRIMGAKTVFDGNVGIGTTTPLEKLHVAGTTTIDANIGTPVNSHWRTGSHTLELQNTDAGEVVLSFHRAGHSNASIRHTSSRGLIFSGSGALGSNHLQIKNNGNVGIGTTNPAAKLALNNSSDYNKILQFGADGPTHWYMGIGNANGDYFHVGDNSNKRLTIKKISGNVGIGTTNPKEKLTVRGKILCSEVEVVMENTIGADYVFQKYYTGASALKADYVMPSLEEVEAFTKANHHLPDVPSAATIKEDGLQLKEMTTLLLQKVEELTLYTIEQEKRIKSLETKLVEKN